MKCKNANEKSIYHDCLTKTYWYDKKARWQLCRQRNGERKTFTSSKPGVAGRRECAEKAAKFLIGDSVVSDRVTVDAAYQEFLDAQELRRTDIYNLRNRYKNHVQPIIGNIKVNKLNVANLREVIDTAYKKHALSRKTLTNLRGDLSSFCFFLADSDIRHDLTVSRIQIPVSAAPSEKNILSDKDIALLFEKDTTLYDGKEVKDYYINAYRFQLLYGLRPGELMGLQWGDIGKDSFTINRSINALDKVTRGKNRYAHRTLPLTPLARKLLEAQGSEFRFNKNDPTERVFGDFQSICYRKRWGIYCEHNGLEYVEPYELRHTFASANKLIPDWILDVVMGHAHKGMSLGTYAHALDDDMDGVAELLDGNLVRRIERGRKVLAASAED